LWGIWDAGGWLTWQGELALILLVYASVLARQSLTVPVIKSGIRCTAKHADPWALMPAGKLEGREKGFRGKRIRVRS